MGFEPTIFRSGGERFIQLSYMYTTYNNLYAYILYIIKLKTATIELSFFLLLELIHLYIDLNLSAMKIRIGGNMSERINKYLSTHGVCSRREADRMIQEGRITIDGRIAVMGEMVEDNTIICVDGRKVDNTTPPQVVIAFNKPVGIVCTTTDKQGKNNIVDFIGYKERIYPVGRLDKESDGLILLTNDGDMMDRLLRYR